MNHVIIRGFLGRDPETRYMPNGDAVTNFSVATTERWKTQDGEKKEHTEWHRCSCFGKRAEVAGEYLKKGSQILLNGRLRTRKWEKDGVERYSTEIIVEGFEFLDRRPEGERDPRGDDTGGDEAGDNRPGRTSGAASKEKPSTTRREPQKNGGKFDDMADDIPF